MKIYERNKVDTKHRNSLRNNIDMLLSFHARIIHIFYQPLGFEILAGNSQAQMTEHPNALKVLDIK